MVDAITLQTISAIAAAVGVCLGVFYWAINLRETTKNRRAALTNSLIQPFTTKDFANNWLELSKMRWDNFEDFKNKYDSRINPENFSARISFWNLCDSIGFQCRSGLIDVDSVYNVAGPWVTNAWLLFGPVIKEYRKSDYSKDQYVNFEYLAETLNRIRNKRDAEWAKKQRDTLATH